MKSLQTSTFIDPSLKLNYQQTLYSVAKAHIEQGISIIPVMGLWAAGQNAKNPRFCVPGWKQYQTQLATQLELEEWFLRRNFGGVAIVLGNISNRVVLEFDDAAIAAKFAAEFPHLTKTYTVRSATRGLPHFYFVPPNDVTLKSYGIAGSVELRANGQIVVTAPTKIDSNPYTVINNNDSIHLTATEWRDIHEFIRQYRPEPQITKSKTVIPVSTNPDEAQLVALYQENLHIYNARNTALFHSAVAARKGRWTENKINSILAPIYANTLPMQLHSSESYNQRYDEAVKTIRSAFNRNVTEKIIGLPTAVREYLLQNKLVSLARVLDCLYLNGYQENDILTESKLTELCKTYKISRKTVRAALQSSYIKKLSITPYSDLTDSANGIFVPILHSDRMSYNTLRVLGCKTGTKNKKPGRPSTSAVNYVVPTIDEICELCGVENKWSDRLTLADLSSSKAYRSGVNRGLFQRRPQQYTKSWLAKRIGVKYRTIRNYIKADPDIITDPQYDRIRLQFDTIDLHMPDSHESFDYGVWLEVNGEKRPPYREIALHHLRNREQIYLVRQKASHYSYSETSVIRQSPITQEYKVVKLLSEDTTEDQEQS